MTKEELSHIRSQFPILSEKVYNQPLIYFDNAATTQKPTEVLNKINYAYTHLNSNIHRGVHYLSQQATEAHEHARNFIADYINAASSEEIIFTRGTTEAINLIAYSYGELCCTEDDEIILTQMEHHSNIVPWQLLAEKKRLHIKVAAINEKGELDLHHLQSLISKRTKLICVTHVSNVLGTINPIKEIVKIAHAQAVPVVVDGAQGIPHLEVDVQNLDADFYVFSGHKVYAPTGIGVLYGKRTWLDKMPPYQGGGEMIQKVTFEKTTFNQLPFKFEAGTPDYIGSTALEEALKFICKIGIDKIAAHETELLQYATERMMQVEGMHIFGTAEHKSSVISFLVGSIHPYDMGMLLDKLGIATRTGHHCAEPLMDFLQIPGTVRISFALYNTKEEIDIFIDALKRVTQMLKQ